MGALVFRIGAANRARGHQPATFARLARLALEHLASRFALPVSD
jgi:hypothetical protein